MNSLPFCFLDVADVGAASAESCRDLLAWCRSGAVSEFMITTWLRRAAGTPVIALTVLSSLYVFSSPARARDPGPDTPSGAKAVAPHSLLQRSCEYALAERFSAKIRGDGVLALMKTANNVGPNGVQVRIPGDEIFEYMRVAPSAGQWEIDLSLISYGTLTRYLKLHAELGHRELSKLAFFLTPELNTKYKMILPVHRPARVTPYMFIESADGLLAHVWADFEAEQTGKLVYGPAEWPFSALRQLISKDQGTDDDGTAFVRYRSRSSKANAGILFERRVLTRDSETYVLGGVWEGAVQYTLDLTGATMFDLAQFDHMLERFGYFDNHPLRDRLRGARRMIEYQARRPRVR